MFPIKLEALRRLGSEDSRFSPAVCFRVALALVVVLATSLALPAAQAASDSKPRITLDEFFNAVDFSHVALSPDGHMVAIATDRADWENERFRQDLWLWRDSDGMLIPLTQSGHDSDPKWSPDGNGSHFYPTGTGKATAPTNPMTTRRG